MPKGVWFGSALQQGFASLNGRPSANLKTSFVRLASKPRQEPSQNSNFEQQSSGCGWRKHSDFGNCRLAWFGRSGASRVEPKGRALVRRVCWPKSAEPVNFYLFDSCCAWSLSKRRFCQNASFVRTDGRPKVLIAWSFFGDSLRLTVTKKCAQNLAN